MSAEPIPRVLDRSFPSINAQKFALGIKLAPEQIDLSEPDRQQDILTTLGRVLRNTDVDIMDAHYAAGMAFDLVRDPFSAPEARVGALCLAYDISRKYDDAKAGDEKILAGSGRFILERALEDRNPEVVEAAQKLMGWLGTPSPDPQHPRYEALLLAA